MQARTAFFSSSSMLAPIMFIGLLVDLKVPIACEFKDTNFTMTTRIDYQISEITKYASTTSEISHNDVININTTNGCYAINPQVSLAKWSFLLSGVISAIPSGIMIIAIFWSQQRVKLEKKIYFSLESDASEISGMSKKNVTALFFCCTVIMTFSNGFAQGTLLQYLQTFVTEFIGWEVKTAALLNFAFGTAMAAGRVVATVVSAFCESEILITYNLILALIGISVCFAACLGYLHIWTIWIGTPLTGFGLAPIGTGVIMWTNQIMGFTFVQATVNTAVMFAGFGMGPMTTSLLLNTLGYMTMIYLVFAFSIFQTIVLFALHSLDCRSKTLRK